MFEDERNTFYIGAIAIKDKYTSVDLELVWNDTEKSFVNFMTHDRTLFMTKEEAQAIFDSIDEKMFADCSGYKYSITLYELDDEGYSRDIESKTVDVT